MFSLFGALCFLIVSLATLAASAPVALRDVYNPHITAPDSTTVWKCGQYESVTWDNSNLPEEVTNSEGMVVLRKFGMEDIEHPLASGFSVVKSNSIVFEVPNVPTRNDYEIVLFGDSGNLSPAFTIECDEKSG
ncbi:hypothetical protein DFJ43DRAFT_226790 [Lentinula guzmanii]|uniref:Uncharacterized protein n=2 Tax=Lentinula TaxID=5352 RepID=A0AA38JLU9_9AGAR|nr:hypothetical protein DFJ43DRAFT_226790 [Lentinula guzmanii]KAJ3781373.1 hypothetical protein GGU10DRAFT_412074 [Lentinula aff. detonsa]